MKKSFKLSLIAAAITASSFTGSVFAQSADGNLVGQVSGATTSTVVKIIDINRGASKTQNVADGDFSFRSIAPGKYRVEVLDGGKIIDTQEVEVTLGGSTSVTMGATQQAIEEVMVTGRRVAAIDTGISETGLVIDSGALNELPVARDLNSVTLLAPGVSKGDVSFEGGGTSFAGASVAENTAYINGLNTTNFRNGLGFSKVPFEFYDTIQVKTGGYSAKYGRSTGGVINARSKSGSNEFDFGINAYREIQTHTQPNTYAALNDMDDFEDTNLEAYASGAIIEDKLFYYVIGNQRTFNQEYYGILSGRGYQDKQDETFWGAKIDAYITEGHRLELTAFSDERSTVSQTYEFDADSRTLGTYLGDTNTDRGGDNWIATYTGDITDSLQVSISAGENKADRTTAPATATIPVVYRTIGGAFEPLGDWTEFLVEQGEDKREMMRFDLSWDLGDHFIEAGVDQEKNTATNNSFNSGGVYWLLIPQNDYAPAACDAADCPDDALVRRRTYTNGGEFEVSSNAFYIQDTWTVNENLTLELGLRNETFENLNSEGNLFVEVKDQWAPRLSFAYDPEGNGRQKFFGSYGLYYLPIAANTNIRMAGGETYIQDYYAWDGVTYNADFTPGNISSTAHRQDVFGNGEVPDTRSLTDANLDAMYQSELIFGYNYVNDDDVTYGAKVIYRNLESTIEDVAIDAAVIDYYNANGGWDSVANDGPVEDTFTGFHQYVLTNPGSAMNVYIPETDEFVTLSPEALRYPEASRQYTALEFTYSRPFDGVWALDASYTWSHTWGNHEGYVKSDNGQDDAGITTSFDQPGLTDGSNGNLPNDRRHTFKAYGMYQLPNGLRLGANLLLQSGRPYACIGVHPTDDFAAAYGSESFYCDGVLTGRGSAGTTGIVKNLDLNAQYTWELDGDSTLTASLDIFNALQFEREIEVVEQNDGYFGEISSYQTPQSVRMSVRYNY